MHLWHEQERPHGYSILVGVIAIENGYSVYYKVNSGLGCWQFQLEAKMNLNGVLQFPPKDGLWRMYEARYEKTDKVFMFSILKEILVSYAHLGYFSWLLMS